MKSCLCGSVYSAQLGKALKTKPNKHKATKRVIESQNGAGK